MNRKTSRRFANYSKQNENQHFNEQTSPQAQPSQQYQQATDYNQMERDNNSMIADMAQGFIQAQANMSDKSSNVNNLEIALLLQKCNNQLEEIRRSAQGNSNSNFVGGQSNQNSPMQGLGQQNQTRGEQDNKEQSNKMPLQELQGLLASISQGKGNNQNSKPDSSTTQSNNNNKASGGNQQNMMAVQTVSQVLAQAQYELANELENSLKKLKQVIAESEKIANNISNLLGEEGTTKS